MSNQLADRDLRSVIKDIESTLDQMDFPEGYSYSIGGEAEDMAESFQDLSLTDIFYLFGLRRYGRSI